MSVHTPAVSAAYFKYHVSDINTKFPEGVPIAGNPQFTVMLASPQGRS